MVVTNKVGQFPKKKWIPGQKTAFFTRNSAFFYATPMKPPFLWLGRSRLNGMTTPPSEMEKLADGADASVLFFLLGCANLWAVYAQIR